LDNNTTKSSFASFQEPLNKLVKEDKQEFPPASLDLKDKVLNAFGLNTNSSTSTILNQQQQQEFNNDKDQQHIGQNVPPPPLANEAQRRQQPDHVESAQAAPQHVQDNQPPVDNSQYQNNLQRSLNNSISENKNAKPADLNEQDDEEQQMIADNVEQNVNLIKQDNFENIKQPINAPSVVKSHRKDYRMGNRKRFRENRNHIQQEERLDNEEQIIDNDNDEDYKQMRKRSVL